MKKAYIVFLLISASQITLGQSRQSVDLYRYDRKIVNPAFMALSNEQTFNLQFRNRSSSEGLISYDNKLSKLNSGIGLMFWNHDGPYHTETTISSLYNYQVQLNKKSKLIFGTELRYQKIAINYNGRITLDPNDVIYSEAQDSNFDLDLGISYQINNFQLGAAAKGVLQSTYENIGVTNRKVKTLYNTYAGNVFEIKHWLTISPSILFETDFSNQWHVDLNANFELNNLFLLGTTLRIGDFGSYQIFNTGISIKDKVQLIALVYSGSNKNLSNSNNRIFEAMIRVKINKDAGSTN